MARSNPTTARVDLYQVVTDLIIEQLENGTVPWHQPWSTSGGGLPVSMSTGKTYRGINVMLLDLEAQAHGYGSHWWGTYDQIHRLGGQVRKGERGSLVVFWKMLAKSTGDTNDDGDDVVRHIPMLRTFKVFNAAQADGLGARFARVDDTRTTPERLAAAESLTAGYLGHAGPTLRHLNGDRAYYRPVTDEVTLPELDQFTTAAGYYSTLFHELTHSTGHGTRLDRAGIVTDHRFGDAVYSQEELVAEMGAAMLCAVAGIPQDTTVPQSAAYIASWLRALRDDKRLVVVAAAQAQKAADLIVGEVAQAEAVAA